MLKFLVPGALAALALAGGLAAQTSPAPTPSSTAPAKPSMAEKLINVPGLVWNVYGPNQTVQKLDKDGPQGYPAIRATVSKKGATPYEVGAVSPIAKPIAAGDVILVAVYMRAPNVKDGETTPISMIGATKSSAPYDTIASGTAAVGNQWKLYYGAGKAPAAFPEGGAQAAVHLAADAHVVDLGPVRVFDLGPDFDLNRLPKN